MSILIKGIEMPEKQTILTIFPNGYVVIYDAKDAFIEETKAFPVPPHGRLIDADALKEMAIPKNPEAQFHAVSVSDIERAPTIIEAEAGE